MPASPVSSTNWVRPAAQARKRSTSLSPLGGPTHQRRRRRDRLAVAGFPGQQRGVGGTGRRRRAHAELALPAPLLHSW